MKPVCPPPVTRPLVILFAIILFTASRTVAAQVLPPLPPQMTPQKQTAATPPAADRNESDDKEDDEDDDQTSRPRATDPAAVLRAARTVYVVSKSVFVKQSEVEDSLRKRKELRAWGMTVTRNFGDADLLIEITRKSLTRRFTFTVLDPKTMTVLTSGKTRSVLFGKKIPNKIAEKFANRVKTVRPYPPVAAAKP